MAGARPAIFDAPEVAWPRRPERQVRVICVGVLDGKVAAGFAAGEVTDS